MRIGSGWKRTAQNEKGTEYVSISIDIPLLGTLQLAMFREEEKKSENSPDYSIVWSKPKKSGPQQSGDNSDIPF